jgi:hypothetical protein
MSVFCVILREVCGVCVVWGGHLQVHADTQLNSFHHLRLDLDSESIGGGVWQHELMCNLRPARVTHLLSLSPIRLPRSPCSEILQAYHSL